MRKRKSVRATDCLAQTLRSWLLQRCLERLRSEGCRYCGADAFGDRDLNSSGNAEWLQREVEMCKAVCGPVRQWYVSGSRKEFSPVYAGGTW